MSFTEFLQVRKKLLAAFCLINFTTGECVIFRVQGKFIGGAEQFAPLLF